MYKLEMIDSTVESAVKKLDQYLQLTEISVSLILSKLKWPYHQLVFVLDLVMRTWVQ